ncbi:MAG: DUF1552 domain-containing protein [Aureliella sp.]
MQQFHRRAALRAAGVSLSVPFFHSLAPGRVDAFESTSDSGERSGRKKRMVCIGNMLGFYPDAFWPTGQSGPSGPSGETPASTGLTEQEHYQLGRTCSALGGIQDKLTLLEGLDHGLSGGHFAIHAFLSGVRQVDAKSMPLANITLDQYAAEFIPGQTRFPTLTIGSESGIHGGCQLSWTRSGTRVPPIPGPRQLFEKLFVGGSEEDRAAQANRFALQSSILDTVLPQANAMQRQLNSSDKAKLDEYLTSVRDVEKRIELRASWIDTPKPEPPIPQPKNRNMVEDLPLLYDLIVLALQTDSTRIATLEIGGDFNPRDLGIRGGYHSLSHHGQRKESIESLVQIEQYQIEQYARFIQRLSETQDAFGSLLEQTSVLFGSGMGNANSHTNSNLPIVLAGGSFRHGRRLMFDRKSQHRPPLTNLFLSMLREFGAEVEQFATSTGTLRGLA